MTMVACGVRRLYKGVPLRAAKVFWQTLAAVSLGRARVDVDVALADLPGCRTGRVGTECGVRVHEVLSGLIVGRILLGPAPNN